MSCRVYRSQVDVRTKGRFDVVDITRMVEDVVGRSGVKEGIVHVFVPHTTCGLTINEAEPGLMRDIVEFLSKHTEPSGDWMHNRIDDNAHAHLGQSMLGHHASLPLANGSLVKGTWQSILLVEMDGPRTRRVIVTVIGV
ncbi:MAG: secondary thiamine-phosphate synthase enzyme YjbQ [Desulfurococcales archaeon]|nr:secondary thiamine-phosphate synthase enzyme YjbQ [Desulfurococcales archaeon]